MGSIQQQLEIYRAGGIICIIFLILSILLAVLFFFLFDIPTIFMLRTGREKKLSLQKIAEHNAKTGSLHKNIDMDYTTMNLDDEQNKLFGKTEETTRLEIFNVTETAPSEPKPAAMSKKAAKKALADFHFEITENVAVIHTNEMI